MIAAHKRADALLQHARYLGAPLEQFVIELTDEEGLEFIEATLKEWEQAGFPFNKELFGEDLELAKATKNPWPMLNHMSYRGLQICRRAGVMQ